MFHSSRIDPVTSAQPTMRTAAATNPSGPAKRVARIKMSRMLRQPTRRSPSEYAIGG